MSIDTSPLTIEGSVKDITNVLLAFHEANNLLNGESEASRESLRYHTESLARHYTAKTLIGGPWDRRFLPIFPRHYIEEAYEGYVELESYDDANFPLSAEERLEARVGVLATGEALAIYPA